jgi:hypothetical protein
MSTHAKQVTDHDKTAPSDSVKTSAVTVIQINPNIAGSGIFYEVRGMSGSQPVGAVLQNGSALGTAATVSVSGYDYYTVDFVGATQDPTSGVFSTPTPVKITGNATVTLALTISQN